MLTTVELIKNIADDTGLDTRQVAKALGCLIGVFINDLIENDKVVVYGLGKWWLRHKKSTPAKAKYIHDFTQIYFKATRRLRKYYWTLNWLERKGFMTPPSLAKE